MHRFILTTFYSCAFVAATSLTGQAQQTNQRSQFGSKGQRANIQQVSAKQSLGTTQTPQVRKLSVPGPYVRTVAEQVSLKYRDVRGVSVAPDIKSQQLVIMATPKIQLAIANDVRTLLNQQAIRQASAQSLSPFSVKLSQISWRQFERDLHAVGGPNTPVTTSDNGNRAAFQLTTPLLQGTTVEVDRKHNIVTVRGPDPSIPGWRRMIESLDRAPKSVDHVTLIHRLINAEPAPIQRALRLLRSLEDKPTEQPNGQSIFRNAVFQTQDNAAAGNSAAQDNAAAKTNQNSEGATDAPAADGAGQETVGGGGALGNVDIRFIPELGQIIIQGSARDVEKVKGLIAQIEEQAKLTSPEIEIVSLKNADNNAVAALLTQLYEDVLSSRQGDVSITALDSPNSLLLIGRKEAIDSLKELINKIDQPVEPSSRLRVFRLQNASASDAEATIRGFFSDQPSADGGGDLRPGLGPRVRILADYRTNSLIVSAAPRDMTEVTRLINEIDVTQTAAQSELKVFPLRNASADELATTLQEAINGTDAGGDENVTTPSTSISIVTVDSDQEQIVDSGILAGATITADTGANAIVVRAPSASMPLIGELIRQLDKAPGIDSLVKVFTLQHGDAQQVLITMETLFGADAATTGTSVGAANLAGLPPLTAAPESSLVPLRFSTDIRTNSIVASGSAEDLEVVESILLRLDSEGFAERITEVIWLKNSDALEIAAAITNYVSQRTFNQSNIQQYNQGLGPYDLPDRDIVAIGDVDSNSVLLSVSPRLYEEVRTLIDQLDRRRPMVMIKLLIAEVALNDTFEMGGELGLQDSFEFNRGLAVGPGTQAAGTPGFNFNNAGVNNVNTFARDTIAAAGASTFGLGTTSGATNYGGFVLNAASESVSLLMRTLHDANRLQVLSDPEVMTLDGTEATINVGRQIARFRGTTVTGQVATQNIDDIVVGLTLLITPRVGRDGVITVNVDVTRSDRDESSGSVVPDGTGGTVLINDIVQTTAQSTFSVLDGQTVIMGGLIQKTRSNFSRRVPYLADIPLVGNIFKFDQEIERRTELLLIVTPTIVSGEQDTEYIKQVESSRMSWCLADVVEAHGDVGLSGGYGLWGPAIGPTIYPHNNPTVSRENVSNEVIVSDVPVAEGHQVQGQSAVVEAPAGEIIYDQSPQQMLEVDASPQSGASQGYTLPQEVNIDATPPASGGLSVPQSSPPATSDLPAPVPVPDTVPVPNGGAVPPPAVPGGATSMTNPNLLKDGRSPIGQASATIPTNSQPSVEQASGPSWLDAFRTKPRNTKPSSVIPDTSATGSRPTRLGN